VERVREVMQARRVKVYVESERGKGSDGRVKGEGTSGT
jgi:hypothetical protein